MTPDREIIRFNALRNALYHTARRRWFERLNRFFNFLVVVLGATAVGDFLAAASYGQAYLGLAVAIIGSLQLVFDFGGNARVHQTLQREYYYLLADIEAKIDPSDDELANWQGRMVRITADEPPMLKALDAKAYNDALDALETFDQGERLVVPFWHWVFGWLFPFDGRRYDKISEIEAKRAAKAT
ncbi:MAG: hypothetical protein KDA73_10485 [Rhodobacteraceae bacterium]|nr:hypothetical protein [Paracoccaceae bacterium]